MFIADHTCLLVNDVEAEQRFYEKALNFTKIEERMPRENVRIVFLVDESRSYLLQLVSGMGSPQIGYGHTAVYSDSFDKDYAMHCRMKCVGKCFLQQERRSYFIKDPEGYEIEILEKPGKKDI